LAHAAQFGPGAFRTRAHAHGYLFRTRKTTIAGEQHVDLRTTQATRREVQTFAFEARLMQAAGLSYDEEAFLSEKAQLTTWLPDWYNVPGKDEEARKQRVCKWLLSALQRCSQEH